MSGGLTKRIHETIRIWESACEETKVIKVLDLKQFGEVLRYHRKEAGISLERMAASIGISAAYLSYCERGMKRLSATQKFKFAKALRAP